ncbi:MAG TPA: lactate utilization protein C [Paucimonas sp.]|nr:lactate utilization protein C [Paucimonas sp.]HJW56225.1 lactate utilization protein C [Burkholderiaceae bacterium]
MDTSAARQAIFERIRKAHGRPAQSTAAEYEAVHDYLRRHPDGPRPGIGSDMLMRFKEQAIRMSDTVDEVAKWTDVPAAVVRYLDGISVVTKAIAWKTLDQLAWAEAGMEVAFRRPENDDLVGITGSFCAVAETGSVMLLSGPDTYASASLLPETHVAILPASRIVAGMEDAFALVRAECGELPRATSFISGPSRTGDIEQTIVLGAHGPYRVHVILVLNA